MTNSSRDDFAEERLRLLKMYGYDEHGGRFRPHFAALMQEARRVTASMPGGVAWDEEVFESEYGCVVIIGGLMESTDKLLNATNDEVRESKKILQELANEVRALSDVVQPALVEQIKSIRQARMTVVSEIRESLSAMRDIRTFFLESNYEIEMQRLERFVRVCREIQALKNEGVFDAVCDSAIRLGVQERP